MEDQEYIKRFLQLKYAIMFLQKTKSIGRYCFYGCWCLPNGAADLGLGTGPPMDDIDRSCREFATCYNCLYNQEIGGACNEENPGRYVIRGRTDPVTDKKTLYCSKYTTPFFRIVTFFRIIFCSPGEILSNGN